MTSKSTSRPNVVHIVPAMNIGGVEVGVERSFYELQKYFFYEVFSMRGAGRLDIPLLSTSDLFKKILAGDRNCVFVTSLWPAHPLGLVARLAGAKWIPFFHNAHKEGWHRDCVTKFASKICRQALCDSHATASFLGLAPEKSALCPYIFDVLPQASVVRDVDLVFVGRANKQKRLDLVTKFYELYLKRNSDSKAVLVLAGTPEEISDVVVRCSSFKDRVVIVENADRDTVAEILARGRFYLNLSDYEGFSMSTVEAIQYGCIPVVRPVGEIAKYVDRESGVVVGLESELLAAVDHCSALKSDEHLSGRIVKNAQRNIARYGTYVDAFRNAIEMEFMTKKTKSASDKSLNAGPF
jgi:glycosyltransferase involved in cell wall biosynthesis